MKVMVISILLVLCYHLHYQQVAGLTGHDVDISSLVQRNTQDSELCDCVEYTFHHEAKSWDGAQDSCVSQGGMLAVVPDESTHQALLDYITNNGFDSLVNRGYWIGLHYDNGNYTWTNDDQLISNCHFETWVPGEPNRKKNRRFGTQECIQMWKSNNYDWDDDFCAKAKQYICMNYMCPDGCSECVE
ncbi:L-selectin-like [Ptychodera flava]|uniref:L-selectin-like n=1 Tax=Ptychodera flava TaxID=63121 RepID=UPI003969EDC5